MVPEITPNYAGNSVFVSLYINNIFLYKLLMESTSYFPDSNYLININYFKQEIHQPNLTVGLTSNQPKSDSKKVYPHKLSRMTPKRLQPLDTTVIWGY
jgi:hypothetical protein